METRSVNSPEAPGASGGYAQAIEVSGAQRFLFISGQIPVSVEGRVPESFTDQARLVWRNIRAQLESAGMGLENIVKHTTFLSDRRKAVHLLNFSGN